MRRSNRLGSLMRRPWPAYLSYSAGVLLVFVTIAVVLVMAVFQDGKSGPRHIAPDDLHPQHMHETRQSS